MEKLSEILKFQFNFRINYSNYVHCHFHFHGQENQDVSPHIAELKYILNFIISKFSILYCIYCLDAEQADRMKVMKFVTICHVKLKISNPFGYYLPKTMKRHSMN
ncbi:hypothetical protein WA026_022834 [Henosepilachna vigintioctopunctata]|uniref:Uncharacterized protein n=1 Tax=Henosepilachna vigintioctopunctata TaxID=420089 RepID=A0AAW1UVI5_9CUCU